jgi:hypothetical protein
MTTATAAKTAKKAPAKKAAKPRRTAKKAAKLSPAVAAAAFAEGYLMWWHGTRVATSRNAAYPLAARVAVCELAGCANPGAGHQFADCLVRTELREVMNTAPVSCLPGLGRHDRSGLAAVALAYRLAALSA